eukprot:g11520.t1
MFLATIGTAAYGFLIFSNFIYPIYEDSIMKHPIESIQTIEESTTFEKIVGSLLYNITHINKIAIPIMLLSTTAVLINCLSWHGGASVLTSTLKYAFGDLIDTLFVGCILLSGFAGFGYGLFGTMGGSRDFGSFLSAFNTMARLSFGLYEYDDYVSDGLGQGYDGFGLGNGGYWKYFVIWLSFILLSTIIINILIAVISDGYELHKDNQRLRTKSGRTFLQYAMRRLLYLFFNQGCCTKCCCNNPDWILRMHFTSSTQSKMLLKYADALPDGMVFDTALQSKVLRLVLAKKKSDDADGSFSIIRSMSKVNISKDDINSDTKQLLPRDETREFFSKIPSEEMLKSVIETIFDLGDPPIVPNNPYPNPANPDNRIQPTNNVSIKSPNAYFNVLVKTLAPLCHDKQFIKTAVVPNNINGIIILLATFILNNRELNNISNVVDSSIVCILSIGCFMILSMVKMKFENIKKPYAAVPSVARSISALLEPIKFNDCLSLSQNFS